MIDDPLTVPLNHRLLRKADQGNQEALKPLSAEPKGGLQIHHSSWLALHTVPVLISNKCERHTLCTVFYKSQKKNGSSVGLCGNSLAQSRLCFANAINEFT